MTITNQQPFQDFVGLSEIQKTLRWRLIPIGKTKENMKKYNVFQEDEIRHKYYPVLKNACDDFYRQHIDQQLADIQFDWHKLDEVSNTNDNEKITKIQAVYRKLLFNRLNDSIDTAGNKRKSTLSYSFGDLFKAKLITTILPEFIIKRYQGDDLEEAKAALDCYKRFTSRLTGFWDTRKNIFTAEDIATGCPNRLVNENFPIFQKNADLYEENKKHLADKFKDFEEHLKENNKLSQDESLDDFFTINAFNKVCTQAGITLYNTLLGGFTKKDNTKIQGINEIVNLQQQAINKGKKAENRDNIKLLKLTRLRKQILAKEDSTSFLIEQIENDQDLFQKIFDFFDLLKLKEVENLDSFEQYSSLINLLDQGDKNKIFISAKYLTKISHQISKDWHFINKGISLLVESDNTNNEYQRYLEIYNDDKDIERLRKQIYFSVADLEKAIDLAGQDENRDVSEISILDYVQNLDEDCNFERDLFDLLERIKQIMKSGEKLLGNTEAINIIKDFLDTIMIRHSRWQVFTCELSDEYDQNFYSTYNLVSETMSNIVRLYNLARNYLSRKPDRMKKMRINFNKPTLADGWSEGKIADNLSMLFRKDGLYYLGIIKDRVTYNKLLEISGSNEANIKKNTSSYERMNYYLLPDAFRSIPKSSLAMRAVKEYFENNPSSEDYYIETDQFAEPFRISRKIYDMQYTDLHNDKKKYQIDYLRDTEDETGYRNALTDWINFCKDFCNNYEGRKHFDYSQIKDAENYYTVNEFYSDIDKCSYNVYFTPILESEINKLIDEGKLYLFQLYNKDFSEYSTGKPNLHTIYWRALFSDENLEKKNIKLNGQAELFFRPKQIATPVTHKKGSIMVNRFDVNGKPIPMEVYQEVKEYKNGLKSWEDLSKETKTGLENNQYKFFEAEFEIIKDRRYTEDQMFFHVPISFNWHISSSPRINDLANQHIVNSDDMHIIGIDRGERHLLYYSVINMNGQIIEQGSLNNITEQSPNEENGTRTIPYKDMLRQREDERAQARLNWQAIDKIKDLKDGYLGQVVHFLAKLIIKYNAIVIMEDLNFGFKRGRFKVERQVYQKFEMALLKKLNALVFKDRDINEIGGALKPWQLTRPIDSYDKMGKQNGILFYVPAAYTSAVDPVTGFANLFNLRNIKSTERIEFFSKFEAIEYHQNEDIISFTFDYNKFSNISRIKNLNKSKWQVYTNGERIRWDNNERKHKSEDLTETMKNYLIDADIDYVNNPDILGELLKMDDASKKNFANKIFNIFSLTVELRNTVKDSADNGTDYNEIDYIISPVKDSYGNFFDSRMNLDNLPNNGDANGAYNIARKGLLYVKQLQNSVRDGKNPSLSISNKDWFKFITS